MPKVLLPPVSIFQGKERAGLGLLCRQDSLKRVLGSRKLLLVLDLDHTLLNSTRLDEASSRLLPRHFT